MILFIIICVIVLSSFGYRPYPYYGRYYPRSIFFGPRRYIYHRPMGCGMHRHHGPMRCGPMGGPRRWHLGQYNAKLWLAIQSFFIFHCLIITLIITILQLSLCQKNRLIIMFKVSTFYCNETNTIDKIISTNQNINI